MSLRFMHVTESDDGEHEMTHIIISAMLLRRYDLYSVFVHEIGHSLGLGESVVCELELLAAGRPPRSPVRWESQATMA